MGNTIMKTEIKHRLEKLDIELQSLIDEFIDLRKAAKSEEKQCYSYVSKKVDLAGKAIGMAMDKIDEASKPKPGMPGYFDSVLDVCKLK